MARPRMALTGPLRVEDPAYLDVPDSIAERSRPAITPETAAFWRGLTEEKVVLDRCTVCSRWTHTPVGSCAWCGGPVEPAEIDGRARVNTFTVCYLEFGPGLVAPYVAALVNPLVEPSLQITTNIVGCRIDEIRCDLEVVPVFVH
ncbi:MAG TPA: OB-fold domain-containing protein, partial [Amycolatopsis sp.]|nr:OB-fold domain-containing protein [Amycolatopsis sp.]